MAALLVSGTYDTSVRFFGKTKGRRRDLSLFSTEKWCWDFRLVLSLSVSTGVILLVTRIFASSQLVKKHSVVLPLPVPLM